MPSSSGPRPRASRPYMPGYEMMFEKGRGRLPWAWGEKRLMESHNYWLVTARPDGRPHVMPVWGVWLGREFYFATGQKSRKARNLAANPNCAVCPEGAGEAVILEGVAQKVSKSSLLRPFIVAYKKKYEWDLGGTEDPIYRVKPITVFGFAETPSKANGNPTRWLFKIP